MVRPYLLQGNLDATKTREGQEGEGIAKMDTSLVRWSPQARLPNSVQF